MEKLMLPCLNKMLFGIECLGCGGQRAAVLLIKGDFTAAFFMYPAIYTLIVLLSFLVVNIFITFKYARQIKITLIIINVLVIVVSYFHKFGHIFLN